MCSQIFAFIYAFFFAMADRQEHQPPPPRQQQRVRRRTSSLSQHPPNGADWELNRHPSTLSPSGVDLGLPTQQPVGSGGGSSGGSTKWVAHPKHRSSPLRSNLRRSVGWPLANLLARDGFLAAALVSNPRGDALPQFWMLQRGVVVFLAISFNACLSQALRYEPPADELYSVGLWRVSTALFVMGSMRPCVAWDTLRGSASSSPASPRCSSRASWRRTAPPSRPPPTPTSLRS